MHVYQLVILIIPQFTVNVKFFSERVSPSRKRPSQIQRPGIMDPYHAPVFSRPPPHAKGIYSCFGTIAFERLTSARLRKYFVYILVRKILF